MERRFPDRISPSKVQQKYDQANTVQIKLKLHKVNDADVLDRLDAVDSKQGYIKSLIRADISKEDAK